VEQQDRLLQHADWRGQSSSDVFGRKHTELRDRLAAIKLQLDVLDRSHDENSRASLESF